MSLLPNTAQHVAVVSHRRSGTHFAIDAIRSNFRELGGAYFNLDRLSKSHPEHRTPSDLRARLQRGPTVVKSHMNAAAALSADPEASACANELFEGSRVIYVHRDGRDMLVSLYCYAATFDPKIRASSFGRFLRMENEFDRETYEGSLNRVEYWCFHVNGWVERAGILPVSFDDLLERYEETIRRIGDFLGLRPRRAIRRVRRVPLLDGNSMARQVEKLKTRLSRIHTSVEFRRGRSGEHRDRFATSDAEYFMSIAGGTMQRLGYLP